MSTNFRKSFYNFSALSHLRIYEDTLCQTRFYRCRSEIDTLVCKQASKFQVDSLGLSIACLKLLRNFVDSSNTYTDTEWVAPRTDIRNGLGAITQVKYCGICSAASPCAGRGMWRPGHGVVFLVNTLRHHTTAVCKTMGSLHLSIWEREHYGHQNNVHLSSHISPLHLL